jgi:hypothetical protein
MRRSEFLLHNASLIAVGATGVLYGVLKYFLEGADPDSRVGNPWTQPALKAHLLAAPFLVFALGLLVSSHALKRFRSGEKDGRFSGIGLLALGTPMVLSGYLVQALTGGAARRWTGWIHSAIGVFFLAAYVAHLLKKRSQTGDPVRAGRR